MPRLRAMRLNDKSLERVVVRTEPLLVWRCNERDSLRHGMKYTMKLLAYFAVHGMVVIQMIQDEGRAFRKLRGKDVNIDRVSNGQRLAAYRTDPNLLADRLPVLSHLHIRGPRAR